MLTARGIIPSFRRAAKIDAVPDRKSLGRLLGLARPYTRRLVIATICMIAGSLLSLSMPLLIQRLIDSIVLAQSSQLLGEVVLGLLGVFLVQSVFNYIQTFQLSYTAERLVTDLRRQLFAHLQTLSLSFYDNQRVGELTSRLNNDVTKVQAGLTGNLISLVPQLITLIGGLTILVVTDWRLLILALLIIPPLILMSRIFGRRLRKTTVESQAALGEATTVLEETLSSPRVVKAFGRENYEVGRYNEAIEESFRLSVERARLRAIFVPLTTLLSLSALAGVLLVGGLAVLSGELTPGQLISQLLYMMLVSGPINSLAGVFTYLQESAGAGQRIFEILDTMPTITEAPDAVPLPRPVAGAVNVEDVYFTYQIGQEVLHGVSLNVAAGEVVALVGPSGAGKTTLASLIPRFYDPTAGRITIDGQDVRGLQMESLREAIAVVPQDPALFGGTIRENIAYGRLEATNEEIAAAAKAANAAGFIADLPDGYNSIIGERGVKLSGGQRQRIAIARAILRNPAILILDEATSSLDNESEMLVRQALERLMRGRTVLVIAHRLTTIERADRIVVMEAGRIVQVGSHTELLEREGLYKRLYTQIVPALDAPDNEQTQDLEQLFTTISKA